MIRNKKSSDKKLKGRRIGQFVVLTSRIGKGAFSEVFEGTYKDKHELIAVKVIPKAKLTDKLISNVESEISLMRQLHHENIVKLLHVHRSPRRFYLFMERCSGGDLATLIKQRGPLPEYIAHKILCDIAFGLNVLNAHKLVHRDLKSANLLLSTPFVENLDICVKIADFGFTRKTSPTDLAETLCGTPYYIAPEILEGKKYDSRADLWSVGVIFYEMLFGTVPYKAMNMLDLLRVINTSPLSFPSDGASQLALQFLGQLLQTDPEKRLTFEQFFNHPYLNLKAQPRYKERSQVQQSKHHNTPQSQTTNQANQITSSTDSDVSTTATDNSKTSTLNEQEFNLYSTQISAHKVHDVSLSNLTSSSGLIQYPSVIFDFSSILAQNPILVKEIEDLSHRAWSIAEVAFLKEADHANIALALYLTSLEVLHKQEIMIRQSGIQECPRLHLNTVWIQNHFTEIMQRAEVLISSKSLSQYGPDQPICVEQELYTQALTMAKEALKLTSSNNKERGIQILKRSKNIIDYLLHDCNIENHEDRLLLEKFAASWQMRIAMLQQQLTKT